jgi:hypothetical protein
LEEEGEAPLMPKETVMISLECYVDLDPEEEIWVDGDCPEDVTLEKVIAEIQKEKFSSVADWIGEWELMGYPEVTITVGNESVRMTDKLVRGDD